MPQLGFHLDTSKEISEYIFNSDFNKYFSFLPFFQFSFSFITL